MDRKETTKFLGDLLKRDRLCGKYWASEVSIDCGTTDVKRVDFMQFEPSGVVGVSGIEKGIFICYEIKSCKADYESGFGRNFIGEKNYFVMPMETYKKIAFDIPDSIGILVPVPQTVGNTNAEMCEEMNNPTQLSSDIDMWKLHVIRYSRPQIRKKSMVELLFCMLRSGK